MKTMKNNIYIKIQRLLIVLGISILGSVSLFAQQDPLYSQYLNNLVSVNPAYAGSSEFLNITTLHRQQWVGIDGAPQTSTLSMNTKLNAINVGIGFSLIYDALGPVKQTGIYTDYSYHVKVTNDLNLAMGLKAGFNNYYMNLIELISSSPDDHVALYGERRLFLPNLGLGLYLYSKHYYLGLSSPKLLENSLVKGTNVLGYANSEARHYFLMGAMLIDLNDFLRMKSSFMSRVVAGSPVSIELTNSFIIKDRLWIGGMYRYGDSIGGLVQYQISPQLRVGYAYDMTQSKLRNQTSGTHEIMITYDLIVSKQKVLSPRFF